MPSRRGRRGGARAQRSHTANTGRVPDPAVAIQRALTAPAQQTLMQMWVALAPQLQGAAVADAVALASDGDVFIAVTDPYWEAHGDELADELGEHWRCVSAAACAAVVALGLTEAAAFGRAVEPPPRDYVAFVQRLARHAARGAEGEVELPSPRSLSAWLDEAGVLAVRHPVAERMGLSLSGTCDSCPHPQADHDLDSGACRRVNPYTGPCPCAHTPESVRTSQRELWQTHRSR